MRTDVRQNDLWRVSDFFTYPYSRGPRAAIALGSMPEDGALLVVDWWEKLAGASLALTAVTRLCSSLRMNLAQPWVRNSMFVPLSEQPGTLPLSAYYDLGRLRTSLAPSRLITTSGFLRGASRSPNKRALLTVVYDDFPTACRSGLLRSSLLLCPPECLNRGVSTHKWLLIRSVMLTNVTKGWPHICVSAAAIQSTLRGAAPPAALVRYRHIVLLNFRRHNERRSMLPPAQAAALRISTVQPANSLRLIARAFLRAHRLPAQYAVVQLRTNHLAHSAHVRGGAANCSRHVASCIRRLNRAARQLAPSSATVVASDLPTLFWEHQDGDSHRRHGYIQACLRPAVGRLSRWHSTAGTSFNCSRDGATPAAKRQVSGLRPNQCDAGALGLVDLLLASEAASFIAVDVRLPWRSAFLEWIVQSRRLAGHQSTLIRCD